MLESFETALRYLNHEGQTRYGELWPSMVQGSQESLELQYKTLSERGRAAIDYSELETQAAYLFSYGMPRALYTREFLGRHRRAMRNPLFAKNELRVASFGGGPASELVGLVRYLEDHQDEGVESIDYHVLDKNGEWEPTAREVIAALDSQVKVTITYHAVDFADESRCEEISIEEADLTIFSYIASELCALEMKEIIKANLNKILATTESGARLLFIESKFTKFIKFFKEAKGFHGRQRNENDEPIDIGLPELPQTYKIFSEMLGRAPRTNSDSIISKWYVKS